MTLKRKLVWIAAVVGAPALIVVTATALTPENAHVERRRTRTRIANVRAEVDRGLSEGASVAEVTRFLDIKHWEHSELVRPEAMFTDGRHYDKTPIIQVLFRNTAHSWLVREDIHVIFVFGEEEKLVRTDVFPIYTGL